MSELTQIHKFTLEKNQIRGVKLLDRKNPNWRKSVNKQILYTSDPTNCVLGQLYGDYYDGIRILFPIRSLFGFPYKIAFKYGFNTTTDGFHDTALPLNDQGFPYLTDLWKAELSSAKVAE